MWNKLQLLFKLRKPLTDLSNEAKNVKRGWKTPTFWLVMLGHLGSIVAALNGYIDPQLTLIANTILAVLYNVARGIVKSHESGVRKWWLTTEFWVGVGSQVSAAFVALQQGGINPEWMVLAAAILNGAMVMARDMAHKQPSDVSNEKK